MGSGAWLATQACLRWSGDRKLSQAERLAGVGMSEGSFREPESSKS